MNCPNCAGSVPPGLMVCPKCGSHLEPQAAQPVYQTPPMPMMPAPGFMPGQVPVGVATRSRLAAGLLGIFLGGLGVHRFYLGYHAIGGIQLGLFVAGVFLTFVCIGFFGMMAACIWGLVEGIMILTGAINCDAEGRPLAP